MRKYYQITLFVVGLLLVGAPVLAEDDGDRPPRDRRHGHHQSFDELDQDGDGFLSFEEVIAEHMQHLNDRFLRIEGDHDGALSEDELKDAKVEFCAWRAPPNCQ